jgi:hypothetical protein
MQAFQTSKMRGGRGTINTPPAAPASVSSTLSDATITTTWQDPADAAALTSYKVYRSFNGGTWTLVSSVSPVSYPAYASYVDPNLSAGDYQYRVSCLGSSGLESAATTGAVVTVEVEQTFGWEGTTTVSMGSGPEGTAFTYDTSQDAYTVGGNPVYSIPNAAAGETIDANTGLFTSTRGPGTYTVTIDLANNTGTGDQDWLARSTAAGVVWAHDFTEPTELSKHLNPARNADQGNTSTSSTPIAPRLLTAAQDGELKCLDITQIGGELAAVFPEADIADVVFSSGTLTATVGATTASISLPLSASVLGIVRNHSVFKITSGANTGIFMDVTSVPVTGSTITFNVRTSARTPFQGSQSGLTLRHVVGGDLANPYQADLVFNEFVDELGEETWHAPTGWSSANPTVVPLDAYGVVLYSDQSAGGATRLYREKVTVVAKSFDEGTGLSTLTVRRAGSDMSYDTGGDNNDQAHVNRFYPCEFPVGTLIGRDITGGWNRPLAPLVTGDNGRLVDGDPVADLAVGGTVTRRQLYNGATKVANFHSGYYGHADYWPEFAPPNSPFPENTIAANGIAPFSGDDLYLSWKMKFSDSMSTRPTPTKLCFIDQYQDKNQSQIVIVSGMASRPAMEWLHNYGGNNPNGNLPGWTWVAPTGEWFAMRLRLSAGHDQEYLYNSTSMLVTSVSKNDTTRQITITCDPIPLASGSTGSDGRYFYSLQNPLQLDPQRSGYFGHTNGSAASRPWNLNFVTGALANQLFKVLEHTVSGSVTTFVVGQIGSTWPAASPAEGDRFSLKWSNMTTSAKYMDSLIVLDKFQAGDTDWVNLQTLNWAITFNGGPSAIAASNCSGWNQFQPTGYANIQDGYPPGRRTVSTRFAEVILSHQPIAAPAL